MPIPARDESAAYYHRYIDRVPEEDVVGVLERQLPEALALFEGISDEKSLARYAAGKWSIRELVNHVNDVERLMTFRAFWFGRGFDVPLPGFDQDPSVIAARPDAVPWKDLLDEFRSVRLATIAFFRNLPAGAWDRRGEASGYPFTVRALAYICAGHLRHHEAVLKEKYL
jgi:hypothetical protein